jgi:LuxR family maltose regulon positive regulatory protein
MLGSSLLPPGTRPISFRNNRSWSASTTAWPTGVELREKSSKYAQGFNSLLLCHSAIILLCPHWSRAYNNRVTNTVLQTKLYIPRTRPSLVHRPRLIEKLNQGLAGKLTLVSAPAGSGKTTCIADWGRQKAEPDSIQQTRPFETQLCWLSLDSYDDDPNRFWQYVLAALETAVPGISMASQELLQTTPLPPPPALLDGLLNDLAEQARLVVLALDDYHVIGNQRIHEGMDYFIEHAPPHFHQVLITRADPPLALPRLRARGLLAEIRAADLRFTEAEATVFLREVMGLPLSAHDVAALEARAEGWITGLQLAAASLRTQVNPSAFIDDLSGSDRFILEYLTEEVLLQQDESVQTFLLQTSILAKMSGPLCDAVTGRDDGQILLDRLNQQELFIMPLDDSGQWYRTHHLLAEMLGNYLRQDTSRERIQALHRRASHWFEENGAWEMAISHALDAAEWERAADLVAQAYTLLLSQGHIATWQQWLEQLPEPLIVDRLELRVRQGWAAFLNGRFQQADTMLRSARKVLLASPEASRSLALRGELATYLATIAFFRGKPATIVNSAQEALAFLPPEEQSSRIRATIALGLGVSLAGETRRGLKLYQDAVELARPAGHVFLLAHSLETLADGYMHMGSLRAATATCRQIIDLGTQDRPAPLPFAGNGYIKLAATSLERRELARARKQLQQGLAISRRGGIGYTLFEAQCLQARLDWAAGDEQGALVALEQAEALFLKNRSDVLALQLATYQVQYWLGVGDVATAATWLEQHPSSGERIPFDELPVTAREVQQVALARVYLAQGKPDTVLAIHDQMRAQAETAGRMSRVIEIGLLQALAFQAKGETTTALYALRRVLALTRPEGYVQILVESGEAMRALLQQLPGEDRDPYVTRLLNAFPQTTRATLSAPSTALPDPLSPRELEVLRLIAAGLSNQQIAVELTVTLNTVKKHSSHVYGKLGVRGRTQAIVRARELELL